MGGDTPKGQETTILMRLLHREDNAGMPIKSIVARLARQLGIHSSPSQAMTFPKWEDLPKNIRSRRLFLRSLLESGSLADLQLMRGGGSPPISPNASIGPLTNFSNYWHHANGACARDETPLYQCYWRNRRFPHCSIVLTDWPECHKWDPVLNRPYPWPPLIQAWSEAVQH